MDSPYVVKMIDSAFLEREYVDKYFKDELIKLEKQSTKAEMNYDLWWGYDFYKLVIMIFEKVENFTNLYNFKGTSTVQPTKLNKKIKIYNKSRDIEQNIKDLKYDLNDFVSDTKKSHNSFRILSV